jgi:tetratricopeptide (TPR) repeat protein
MNRCWKRRNWYALGSLVAVLLGMGRAEAAMPRGGELGLEGMVERVAQSTESPEADRLLQEGVQLYQQRTAESLRGAIEKWEEARRLYREAGVQDWEALALIGIGRVYSDLGEKQKALDYYNQALPLFQAVGNRSGEATTLTNIGTVYSALGEQQTALDYYNQALPLRRAVGDRSGEATTLTNIGTVYSDLGEQQKALDYHNQALPLFQAVGDRSGEANTLNNIGLVYSDLGEQQTALDYYNQALLLHRAVGDRSGEATTLTNIGTVYSALGEQQTALDYYNQALLLHRAVGDRSGEATTLNNIGLVCSALGEQQTALDYYNQALPLFQAVGDRSGEATTLTNIGVVYSALGEQQTALDYFNQALSLRRAVGDRSGEATTLNNIGVVYSALGEQQTALDYFNQALLLHRAVGARSGEATTLTNIGRVYSALGEQQKALDYYNQALLLHRAVGDRSGEATTLNNIGLVYSALGEKQKALDYYNQALLLHRAVGARSGEATTLTNIGRVYSDLGEQQKALDYYNQALPLFQAVGDRTGEAATLHNIGTVYSDLGEQQKALDYYNQALPLFQAVGDRTGEATTLHNIGTVYSDLGEQQKALDYYNQALPLRRAVGDRSGEAATLRNLAYLHRDQNNLTEALTSINAAIDLIEQLRSNIASDDLRMSYFASVQDYYQFQLDLLMQLHQQHPERGYEAQAFNTSERSRARVLLELLYESNLDIRQGVDPQLLEDEDQLLQKLKEIEARRIATLSRDHTEAEIAALDKETDDTLAQLDLLKVQLKADNPAYAALQYPEPLTLPQIQQQVLDPDSLLLQYAIGEDRSYLWAVTPTQMTVYTLPGAAELAEAIEPFRSAMENSGNSPADIADAATALGDLILAPVADQLPGKRLLIVADGELHAIPFAALSEPGKADYTPLITQHEIVNLPSASAIAISRQQVAGRTPAPKTLAVLADPVYTADDPRLGGGRAPTEVPIEVQRNLRDLDLRSVARLPYTRQEADTILALVPANQRTAVFDFDANYDWATQSQLNQYRYIHFATHGFANPSQPELSGILLSLVNPQGGQQDKGILRLHDIFNLDLPAELVVLSACQTGLGADSNGEGLIGLTRGLMYAGTPRALVSLWNVNDEKTSILMAKFYRGILEEGLTPATSLRQAQIQMWQEYRDPNLWAAFVLQGEWN